MKITISGYKSIGDARSIEVKGLTILSGANSSGKSSFMQPLLLIKQSLESEFDAGALLLDGPNVRITDSKQIVSRVSAEKVKTMTVSFETKSGIRSAAAYDFKERHGVQVRSVSGKSEKLSKEVFIKPRMSSKDLEAIIVEVEEGIRGLVEVFKEKGARYKVVRDRCFLHVSISLNKKSHMQMGFSPMALIDRHARRLIHVPGLRGNPERSYKTANSEDMFPGSFERYVASIIHTWRTSSRGKVKFEKLLEQLNYLGLASYLGTTSINETRLEIGVSRYKGGQVNSKDLVNIADVGFGVSQTLPVLVALLAASKGQIVYIEQPELHLHPRAQHGLARIICEAVKSGVLVVIETHSSILIRGIQTLVAKRELDPGAVSLNWFTQNSNTGQSEVSSTELDEYGAFGDWPEDFDSVALDVEGEYLDAVEAASHER